MADNENAEPSLWIRLLDALKSAFVESDQGPSSIPRSIPSEGPSWLQYVAVLTGLLAAITGILAVRSTRLTNDAIYESSLAVLAQAQASDAWSEYQADSIKARILESQSISVSGLSANDRDKLLADMAEMRGRQPQLKQNALNHVTERDVHLSEGRKRLAEKDLLEYASLAAQLGIALASIAAITKRHQAFALGIVSGISSVGLLAYTFIQHYVIAVP
jgi:hypothetical protein